MMTTMRAKFVVSSVDQCPSGERVNFNAVAKSPAYPSDGSDEDNTFAKFSPSANCSIFIANPALWQQFKAGDKFYVDFTPAS